MAGGASKAGAAKGAEGARETGGWKGVRQRRCTDTLHFLLHIRFSQFPYTLAHTPAHTLAHSQCTQSLHFTFSTRRMRNVC